MSKGILFSYIVLLSQGVIIPELRLEMGVKVFSHSALFNQKSVNILNRDSCEDATTTLKGDGPKVVII